MRKEIQDLKELAIAYKLALEFDYCPSPDELADAKTYVKECSRKILEVHQGSRPDEIANSIIRCIESIKP